MRYFSKRKQQLYETFSKHRNDKNYLINKIYKNLFEKLKKKSKNIYFQDKSKQYERNIKNTWNVTKTVTGKSKISNDSFRKNLDINKKDITDKKIIAETFDTFFINEVSNLADKKYYPLVYLEECRYEIKKKKMIIFIDAELELEDLDDFDFEQLCFNCTRGTSYTREPQTRDLDKFG